MHAPVTISTFYSFVDLKDPASLRAPIRERMESLGIRGTITLAREGINATISGAGEAIDALMAFLATQFPFTTPTRRESHFGAQPFKRTKVKVKRELISIGVPTFPAQCVGQYVQPKDWNELISAPDVITIDTRNAYEFELGHFEGAVNPATRNFKQMVKWTEKNLLAEREHSGHPCASSHGVLVALLRYQHNCMRNHSRHHARKSMDVLNGYATNPNAASITGRYPAEKVPASAIAFTVSRVAQRTASASAGTVSVSTAASAASNITTNQ